MSEKRDALLQKALALPRVPGVYLMQDVTGKIIYVGKSKSLRDRVSQYFADFGKHNAKTDRMVSLVHAFDVMLTATEMDALSLENQLIKLHMPKYNIRLKDAKSYPYIKLTMQEQFPRIQFVRRREKDGAKYFGPYSSDRDTRLIIQTAEKMFQIPTCKHTFPRDIGKIRPCLYADLGRCSAPCTGKIDAESYRASFAEVIPFLQGNYHVVKKQLTEKMEAAAEALRFETAAQLRNRILALARLTEKQKVVGAPDLEQDVFALYRDDQSACLAVYYIRGGAVLDSDTFAYGSDTLFDEEAILCLIADLYARREYIPREILLGFPLEPENLSLLSDCLASAFQHKVTIRMPQRGAGKDLCAMVYENAKLHAALFCAQTEKENATLVRLAQLLELEVIPEKIESFDISNLGGEHITAGKIALLDGKFRKKLYRTYKIRITSGEPDDYASMREAVLRRLSHVQDDPLPDLFLLDGGKGHVSVVRALLAEQGIDIPVFGMVKDAYHKTRALTGDSEEISIAKEQAVFQFLFRIQEEVHRYTIGRMQGAKRKTLTRSALENIPGIGPAKAKALRAHFSSLTALRNADTEALSAVPGISARDAESIRTHFASKIEPKG